jgi:hypothetical protein
MANGEWVFQHPQFSVTNNPPANKACEAGFRIRNNTQSRPLQFPETGPSGLYDHPEVPDLALIAPGLEKPALQA